MDWKTATGRLTPHFTIGDAIWLPKLGRLANDAELTLEYKANLILLFDKLEIVRLFFNRPIIVHVAFRPPAYNKLVKGAKNSAHLYGNAVDFHVVGLDCDEARKLIVPKLEEWKMRCEDLPGSNWVHLDVRSPGKSGKRFFIP